MLADDSGIEAAALGGVPGVRSARYAGEDATDEQNLAKLIAALEGADDRRVRYVAELVAIAPDGAEADGPRRADRHARPTLRAARAASATTRRSCPDGETRTVAEMSPDEKDAISHRARAARTLLPLLEKRGQTPIVHDATTGSDPNVASRQAGQLLLRRRLAA